MTCHGLGPFLYSYTQFLQIFLILNNGFTILQYYDGTKLSRRYKGNWLIHMRDKREIIMSSIRSAITVYILNRDYVLVENGDLNNNYLKVHGVLS